MRQITIAVGTMDNRWETVVVDSDMPDIDLMDENKLAELVVHNGWPIDKDIAFVHLYYVESQ